MFRNCFLIKRNVNKSLHLVLRNDFFTEFETKILRFQSKQKELSMINLEEKRQQVNKFLNEKTDSKVLYDNVKSILYLGKTDEDFKLILKCIEKLNDEASSEFKIHCSFIRLLYSLNRIDVALECFKNEKLRNIFMQDLKSIVVILDKLIEDKKYDEALQFFRTYIKNMKKVPSSILNAVTLCLLKINSKESLLEAKNLVEYCNTKKFSLNLNSIVQIFMLSINQKDYLFALNFLGKTNRVSFSVHNNLLAIIFSCMNQPIQSLTHLNNLVLDTKLDSVVFKTTLDYIENSIGLSNNKDLLTKYENIKKDLIQRKKHKNEDIVEFYSKSSEGVFSKNAKKFYEK
ncbi:unnamed protein product [Brachionus calyciflorus]|uniref:Pentatricopeptide repeat-containing protein 2 n=1 Tax=Brachionus calyciflorus TaxID=104777 RepID=A0A814ENJ6_9BILA|nr:unnamed protein product [Brachionus calyciflorus]